MRLEAIWKLSAILKYEQTTILPPKPFFIFENTIEDLNHKKKKKKKKNGKPTTTQDLETIHIASELVPFVVFLLFVIQHFSTNLKQVEIVIK